MSSIDSACSWKAALLTSTSSRPNASHRLARPPSAQNARVLHVAGDQQAAPALGLDAALRLLGVVVLVEVGDGDVGALAREQHRDRAADARVAAGDDRRDMPSSLPLPR